MINSTAHACVVRVDMRRCVGVWLCVCVCFACTLPLYHSAHIRHIYVWMRMIRCLALQAVSACVCTRW